jgi:preprotein translocase subunit SecA
MALAALARKIFGSPSDRQVKRYQGKVAAINTLEPELAKLSDDALRARTAEFKAQIAQGAKLEDLVVPAFATVREASKRVLGMRHFDTQLIGGMVLNDRAIAEMRTGEGKTLVATLPMYLNALTGKGAHLVTVNDYLVRRDAAWMGQVYGFLGLTTGVIVPGLSDPERQAAYQCDITYGTNNELGFDYLRDNMKYTRAQMVQRGHEFAIVDEVDSILIDEARTPLIISGPSEDRSDLYTRIDSLMPIIGEGDFEIDEKQRAATFTDQGVEKLEAALAEAGLLKGDSMYDVENVALVHHANSALRAHKLFRKDKDYIVRNDEVVIIDEFSGRMMPGRRYSEGLHQALEAKEHVKIQAENQTLASITFQNYFRLYKNLPVQRIDEDDAIFRTAEEKFDAIADLIKQCHERGQPVLVGTTSIEKSEMLADILRNKGVGQMNVLNARHHEQEAFIVADAGLPGAITIATNMAGRGTDIQLGGNFEMRVQKEAEGLEGEAREAKIAEIKATIADEKQKALAAGGLMVIGTERHESRRIDNQLRGRSGRQGDPGHSKFFLSLQDDLMRIFPIESMDSMLGKLGLEQGESITHPWVTKAIERAQGKVEARNFDIRKNILKYDDVMNDQRKVIFEQRLEFMDATDVSETISDMRHGVVSNVVSKAIPPRSFPEQWNIEQLQAAAKTYLNVDIPAAEWAAEDGIDPDIVEERIREAADKLIADKEKKYSAEIMRQVEKSILLQSVDGLWREHLVMLDHLSKVVGWRGIAQRDPLTEYKQEAYELFQSMLGNLRELVTTQLSHIELQIRQPEPPPPPAPDMSRLVTSHIDPTTGLNDANGDAVASRDGLPPIDPQLLQGVSRNAPCPCGSGKKFKHCHGQF